MFHTGIVALSVHDVGGPHSPLVAVIFSPIAEFRESTEFTFVFCVFVIDVVLRATRVLVPYFFIVLVYELPVDITAA